MIIRIAMPIQIHVSFRHIVHVLLVILLFIADVDVAAPRSIINTLTDFSGDLPFKLETGYVGVGDAEDLQLFYYFVESERSPENDPLLLWLTGGPCCSSVSALLYEIGPLSFDYSNSNTDTAPLILNPYSWTKVANIIFLDAPAGTGFSYSISSEGYPTTDTLFGAQVFEFIKKWLVSHPKFIINPLYIGGDSYSGKIVPIVVQQLSNGIEAGDQPPINLKGYILGNPVTDTRKEHYAFLEFAHRMGLLSDRIYKSAARNCKGEDTDDVDPNNVPCIEDLKVVNECIGDIFKNQILLPRHCQPPFGEQRILQMENRQSSEDNFVGFVPLPFKNLCQIEAGRWLTKNWGNKKEVKKSLKVREETKTTWTRCNRSIPYTFDVQSSVVYHRNLTKKFLRALIYSGDHDMVVPYFSTIEWIESLGLAIDYDWRPWFSDHHEVLGYTMKYTNKKYQLTYATIKGGGHTAPQYYPEECFRMFDRWLAHYPL
ncbi:serine carboxypeptidase-like 18 [Morus notabilis]|uniref:serine carboxypeptidase-like 18 n=1 Tax=Morus notabilis TaxID=981085 RepID=UPI000CED7E5D|nr:serine carboxypeptidase-like 18 [Morus notabilis]